MKVLKVRAVPRYFLLASWWVGRKVGHGFLGEREIAFSGFPAFTWY
jgi:hypothetical protein